jgi:LPXTG-motif cell wall-anchored protein
MYGAGGGIAAGGGGLVAVGLLPRTGFNVMAFVLIGVLLILAGLVIVRTATVRRH